VAGFDRLLRPIADWSMLTTLCTCRRRPRVVLARQRARVHQALPTRLVQDLVDQRTLARAGGAVIATSAPSGNRTSTLLRLFSRARARFIVLPFPLRRRAGVSIPRRPERYCPVGDALTSAHRR